MNKKLKFALICITFGVCLFVGLTHISSIWSFLVMLFDIFLPIAAGGIIAFLLNVPMKGFEKLMKRLSAKTKKGLPEKFIHISSLLLTVISIVLVIVLVCLLVVPAIVTSVVSLYNVIMGKIPDWINILKENGIDTTWLSERIDKLDMNTLISNLTSGAGNVLNVVINAATSTVSAAVNTLIAIIIALYFLLEKKDITRQCKKLLYANIKTSAADKIMQVGTLINNTFSKFISGQCVETLILGALLFISLSIFRLPYASLIAVLAAVCSFIPYIGAFAACVTGALLTLMTDPVKALICIAVYLVVQFVESQFIYPRVVGNSVGLEPVWTLLAALVGGGLFGIVGMIFFIPLTAVIVTLLKGYVNARLVKKEIKIE